MRPLSLLRLRQELAKLLEKHTESIKDSVAKATKQSTLYESVLQGLSVSSAQSYPNRGLTCLFIYREALIKQAIPSLRRK